MFLTFLYSAYVSIWSLATIFDDGTFLADFLSRWNYALVVITQHPFEKARSELWWSLGWIIFYITTMIVLFIWDLVPAVRGTSDLLSLLLLRAFVSEVHLTKHFYLARIFGLFFHLYAAYAARAITLWMSLYCKFLENLARFWNLRFAYVFGMRNSKLYVNGIFYLYSYFLLRFWNIIL